MKTRLTRRTFVRSGALAGSGLIAGCLGNDGGDGGGGGGDNSNDSGSDGGSQSMEAVLSVPSLEFTFFTRMQNAFETATKQGSIAGSSTFYDAQNTQSQQISDIETAVTKDVDFIMVSAITSEGIVPAIKQANQANIPVVTIDRNVTQGEIATYVASDNVALGARSSALCLEFMQSQSQKSTYNIVQLEGTPGASVTNDRAKGFNQTVNQNDNLTKLASQTGEFSTETALGVMEDFITNFGNDIHGVYAQNDLMALGALQAINNSNLGLIPISGIDGSEAWVEKFSESQYYGTIAQLPEEMVNTSIEKGKMAVNDKQLEDSYTIEGLKVTQENAQDYLGKYFSN